MLGHGTKTLSCFMHPSSFMDQKQKQQKLLYVGEIDSGDSVKASISIPLECFCSRNEAQQSSAGGRHTAAPVGAPEPDAVTLLWRWLLSLVLAMAFTRTT